MDSPSPKRLRSESEAESADKDRISCLPEDVIGFILSLLTSREAQATCLLSKRWRHLSTCRVTNLDFDWSHLLVNMREDHELVEKERVRYVEWVDNVLHLHCQSGGYHLRSFALRFDLNISYKSHIDRWISFALANRVKVLQLDFEPASLKDSMDPSHLPYLLGHETFMDVGCSQGASGLSIVGLSPSSSWHVGFRDLEELYLNRVSVEGELIEQVLANCPFLERLTLHDACTSNKLRVSGQSLKLKYLCIICCHDLGRLEIYDMNLVSFTFTGPEIPLCLDKLPRLYEVSIGGIGFHVHRTLSQLSSLSSMHILKLEFSLLPHESLRTRQLPKLTSIEQLELRVGGFEDASLLPLTPVIEACPCLRSFVLELKFLVNVLCRQRELKRVDTCPHQHLKEVKFYNYYGRPCDLELVFYLVENAIALEKLVVNPCEEEFVSSEGEKLTQLKNLKEPRERALQQLKGKLPSKIDLVFN